MYLFFMKNNGTNGTLEQTYTHQRLQGFAFGTFLLHSWFMSLIDYSLKYLSRLKPLQLQTGTSVFDDVWCSLVLFFHILVAPYDY